MMQASVLTTLSVLLLLSLPVVAGAQEDVADVPSDEIRLGEDEKQRYSLIGAQDTAPEEGYALLLVLPGGDGSAEFNPFIRRIWKHALPEGFLVAQLIAVPSDRKDHIVWPTAKAPDPKQTFTTERFIDAVIGDVKSRHKVDESRIFALGWSSGGPAVYAASLAPDTALRGAFIAMSVFIPARLPPLNGAKNQRYYLLQSPQDNVTKFHFAQMARDQLTNAGAEVKLQEYVGGHGWRGNVFGEIRAGIEWLQEHRRK